MGLRKQVKKGRSGGWKMKKGDYQKLLTTAIAEGAKKKKSRALKRVAQVQMSARRKIGRYLPRDASTKILEYLGQ